ncbi:MAG: hypothetical protein Q8P57_01015 [Candidatus Pacearchaeota archaeon]|nr:hypothetical protein [Candidatus Pacearchaeota archaeon]
MTSFRQERIPLIKMDFDLGGGGFAGDFTCVVAPRPTPQINSDFLRRTI